VDDRELSEKQFRCRYASCEECVWIHRENRRIHGKLKIKPRFLMNLKNYLNLFWLVPAVSFLLPVLMMIVMALAPPGGLGDTATEIYERVFWITPVVGILVLFVLLVLSLTRSDNLLKQINPGRTLALAVLDVVAPAVFLVLQVILSGALR